MLCIIIHLKIEINGVKKNFFEGGEFWLPKLSSYNFKKKSRKLHQLHQLHFGVNLRDPRVLESN